MKYWLLLLLLPLFFVSCHDNDSSQLPLPDGQTGHRTVLVYMAAQNTLGLRGYQLGDSTEIMAGRQYIAPNDRLLMLIDDKNAPRLYQVLPNADKPRLVKQWDVDFCTTDYKRLQEVLTLVRTTFPANEYGLAMWSHADGWISPTDTDYDRYSRSPGVRPLSFGIDSGPDGNMSNKGAQMSIEEMARAMQTSGFHCKFVFFDACLMQNIETAYALRYATDYVIASPVATPAAGSYYTHNLQKGFFSDNPADIASTYLADVMSPELAGDYDDFGISVACVQTAKLQALADVLREALPHSKLANHQSPEMTITDSETGAKTGVLFYQPYTDRYSYRPHNYDALQALRCILPDAYYEKAKAALDEAVVFHGATPRIYVGPGYYDYLDMPLNNDDYCSVSMFIPQDVYTRNAKQTRHGDLNADFRTTEWYAAAEFAITHW